MDIEQKIGVCQVERKEKDFLGRRKLCAEDLKFLLHSLIFSCRGGSDGGSGTRREWHRWHIWWDMNAMLGNILYPENNGEY